MPDDTGQNSGANTNQNTNADAKAGDTAHVDPEAYNKLRISNARLEGERNTLQSQVEEMRDLLADPDRMRHALGRDADATSTGLPPGTDVDDMTPAQLAQFFEQRFSRRVADEVGRLEKKMQHTEISRSVEEAKMAYSDFDELIPDMQRISNRHPTLSAKECYRLAKSDKLLQLEAQVKKTEADSARKIGSDTSSGLAAELARMAGLDDDEEFARQLAVKVQSGALDVDVGGESLDRE